MYFFLFSSSVLKLFLLFCNIVIGCSNSGASLEEENVPSRFESSPVCSEVRSPLEGGVRARRQQQQSFFIFTALFRLHWSNKNLETPKAVAFQFSKIIIIHLFVTAVVFTGFRFIFDIGTRY